MNAVDVHDCAMALPGVRPLWQVVPVLHRAWHRSPDSMLRKAASSVLAASCVIVPIWMQLKLLVHVHIPAASFCTRMRRTLSV